MKYFHNLASAIACISWVTEAALAEPQDTILYLLPYANAKTQIHAASVIEIGQQVIRTEGALSWLEQHDLPDIVDYQVVERRIAVDTERLGRLAADDWAIVRKLARAQSDSLHLVFYDGAEFAIRYDNGLLTASPTGGEIGRSIQTHTLQRLDALANTLAVAYPGTTTGCYPEFQCDFETKAIGPEVEAQFGLLANGVDCGPESDAPETHCALFSVRIISRLEGTICTGTLVSPRHIVTAAHCVCDRVVGGQLSQEISASIGFADYWAGLQLTSGGVHIFDRAGATVCADSGLSLADRQKLGDLAILSLAEDALASAIDRLIAIGVRESTARNVLAHLPTNGENTAIWETDQFIQNRFTTYSFGVGPDGHSGKKRAMSFTFRNLSDCVPTNENETTECQSVQEAIFRDESEGLCAGDSGGGVFKWAESTSFGYGRWVLMGVAVGYVSPSICHDPDTDELLNQQYERNIVRIDTPLVRAWIEEIVGSDNLSFVAPLFSPTITVAAGDDQ